MLQTVPICVAGFICQRSRHSLDGDNSLFLDKARENVTLAVVIFCPSHSLLWESAVLSWCRGVPSVLSACEYEHIPSDSELVYSALSPTRVFWRAAPRWLNRNLMSILNGCFPGLSLFFILQRVIQMFVLPTPVEFSAAFKVPLCCFLSMAKHKLSLPPLPKQSLVLCHCSASRPESEALQCNLLTRTSTACGLFNPNLCLTVLILWFCMMLW